MTHAVPVQNTICVTSMTAGVRKGVLQDKYFYLKKLAIRVHLAWTVTRNMATVLRE